MAEVKIDYDRGVIFQDHPATGMKVYMYVDEPGVYLNAHGNVLPEVIAREAHFDVEKFSKEKAKRERMKAAAEAIEQEFSNSPVEHQILSDVSGFKIVDIGLGRHNVIDPDGNKLNAVPLTKDVAELLVARLVPDAPPKKEKAEDE